MGLLIIVENSKGERRKVRPGERHDGFVSTGVVEGIEDMRWDGVKFRKCSACGKDGVYEYG